MLKHSNTSKSKNKYSKDYEGKRFVKEDAHIASVSNFSLLENYSTLTPAPFCVSAKLDMERVKGIEPSYSDWQPDALPLCYTRTSPAFGGLSVPREGIEPPTRGSSERFSWIAPRIGLYHHPAKSHLAIAGVGRFVRRYVELLPFGIVSTPSPTRGRSLARDCPSTALRISPNSPNFSSGVTARGPKDLRPLLYH